MFFGVLQNEGRLSPADWRRIDPACDRLEIEIGPGDCRYLAEAAAQRLDTLFVGFEMRPSTLRSILARGPLPGNVRLLHSDGRWVVENIIGKNSVDAYHVYFPDSWWKKRHHKRRLFRLAFAEAVAATLKPGAGLYLISDVSMTFADAQKQLLRAGLLRLDWQRHNGASGSYERKYRRQGRPLYQARFQRPGPG